MESSRRPASTGRRPQPQGITSRRALSGTSSRLRTAALALACLQGELSRPLRIPPEMSPARLWRLSGKALSAALRLRPAESARLASFRNGFSAAAVFSELRQKDIGFVALGEHDYPAALKQIYDPPPGLFFIGEARSRWEEFMSGPRIAIVGARAATRYGIDVALSVAAGLSREAVCVVSGMALGIDAAAHKGAIKGKGSSIAVLGCGVDVIYPRSNRLLYKKLLKAGLVVSEYPPGIMPRNWRFPARNRIISGLSSGVLVVEAGVKSGALITADFCLEQGREVYAVPGNIFSEKSAGPNGLIRMGATAVTGARDILDDMGIECASGSENDSKAVAAAGLSAEEKRVYAALEHDCSHPDELARRAGMGGSLAAAALVNLELKGLARHEPGLGYSRSPP